MKPNIRCRQLPCPTFIAAGLEICAAEPSAANAPAPLPSGCPLPRRLPVMPVILLAALAAGALSPPSARAATPDRVDERIPTATTIAASAATANPLPARPGRNQDPWQADGWVDAMVLFARIWGLAKYHHPAVVACQVDWDQALFAALPRFESAETSSGLVDAVQVLLAAAGPVSGQAPDAGTPLWIRQAPLPVSQIRQLAWLAAQRPQQQCYVDSGRHGIADFSADAGDSGQLLPERPQRVLALFRFWNAIEYFFPYHDVIPGDWAQALAIHLPAALAVESWMDWLLRLRQFTAAIGESHAHLAPQPVAVTSSSGTAPFRVGLIEGRLVVTRVLPEAGDVSPGDELLAVDDIPARHLHRNWLATSYGSNPIWRHDWAASWITAGRDNPGRFHLRRVDGSRHRATLPRNHDNWHLLQANPRPPVRVVQQPGCRIGVLNLGQLARAMVPWAMQQVADTDALVVDARGYPPDDAIFALANWLYDAPRQASWLTVPDLTRPGSFNGFPVSFQGHAGPRYAGRILALHDEDTISASEYAVMILQGTGRALTLGSQTAAGDGEITYIQLPGRVTAYFSGMAVQYPDGRATQPNGLVPDIHVHPSRAGLAARRDEVLDAALDCHWLDHTPPRRLPQPGIYAADRSAARLDAYRHGDRLQLLVREFDDAGEPVWLHSHGAIDAPDDGRGSWADRFLRPQPEGGGTVQPGHAVDFHAGPYEAVCADVDQYTLHPRAQWLMPDGAGGRREHCALPHLLAEGTPLTGLWQEHIGGGSSWRLGLHQRGNRIEAVVYGFDDAGEARWLAGSTRWRGSGAVSIALWRQRGCDDCERPWQEQAPAGTLTVRPAAAGQTGTLQADIHAVLAAGTVLHRQNVTLVPSVP